MAAPAGYVPYTSNSHPANNPTCTLFWREIEPTAGFGGVGPPSAPPWPVVICVHGGVFWGEPTTPSSITVKIAQEFAAKGFFAVHALHRLAPPGKTCGQQNQGADEGLYPEAIDDIGLAIQDLLVDSRCNGRIFGAGGSSGGTFIARWATQGIVGVSGLEAGVTMSGVFDLTLLSNDSRHRYEGACENWASYLGDTQQSTQDIVRTIGHPLYDRSEVYQDMTNARPLFMVNGDQNGGSETIPPAGINNMAAALEAVGITSSDRWATGTYVKRIIPGGGHSWDNWNAVRADAIQFIIDAYNNQQSSPPPPGQTDLLPYTAWLTTTTPGANVDNIFGIIPGDVSTAPLINLSSMTPGAQYRMHLQANSFGGRSKEAVFDFTADPSEQPGGGGTFKRQPAGLRIIFTQPGGITPPNLDTMAFWDQDEILGSRYRARWSLEQQTQAPPAFNDIATYVSLSEARGKKACISVGAGIATPSWVLAKAGIQTVTFLDDPDPGTMPMPWDPIFLNFYSQFIRVLGERFDSSQALDYIVVAGLGRVIETYFALSAGDMALADAAAVTAGYADAVEGWLYAVSKIIPMYSRAFPTTCLLVSLGGPVANSHDPTGNEALISMADSLFGVFPPGNKKRQIGFMQAGLNENSNTGFFPNELVQRYAPLHPAGFQMLDSTGGTDITNFEARLLNGIELGAHFLELYAPDAHSTDPAFVAARIAANNQLINSFN